MEDKKCESIKDSSPSTAAEVGQQMEQLQIECPNECSKSNNEKPNRDETIQRLQKTLGEKQHALDLLKDQYNKVVIELENLRKQIAGASNNMHPGSDLCVSPMVGDARLQSEIHNKNYKIAGLENYVRGYYELVLGKIEENNCLLQQVSALKAELTQEKERTLNEVQDIKSHNKKLYLQADDLKGEKERLYDKLSKAESELDLLRKAKEDGKKNFTQQNSVPETETEKYETMVADLRLQNQKLKQEIENHKQHSRDQEDKIEKLTVRCGIAEEDVKRMSMVDGHSDKSADTNNWPVRSSNSRDAMIEQLNLNIYQRDSELERLRQEVELLRNRPTADPDDEMLVKEQLKAFQDDYRQERQEKVSLLQEKNALEKRNEYLLHQLHQRQQLGQMSGPTHPHERHYAPPSTPRHPSGREEPGHCYNYNTPPTRLPGPRMYENAIPPRDTVPYGSYPQDQHPVQSQPYHSTMPAPNQDMQSGGYHNRPPNRGNSRENFGQ